MNRTWRLPLAGFLVGGLLGVTLLTVNSVGGATPSSSTDPRLDVLHTPPLLASRGEPIELDYEVVCGAKEDGSGGSCSPEGSVHVRRVGESHFADMPLAENRDGRLTASLPGSFTTGAGFDYYADIADGHGDTVSLPEGGAAAPQHVWSVPSWTAVELPAHAFGTTRPPTYSAVRAGWGPGNRALGLDRGPEQATIGPSAFDVAPDGSIVVLDQVNRRLAVYPPGPADGPRLLPITFAGGEGDLSIDADGTIDVLDDGGVATTPVVRLFDPAGREVASTPLAEPVADMLRISPAGPVVHAYPSEMWLPTLATGRQTVLATAGRPVGDGLAVVVRASPTEARFALVRGDGVVKAWRLASATDLGEVQLAEPYGNGLVVVVRLWTEKQAEFRVLRLTPEGLADGFSVDRAEWAQTASVSRFRLRGSRLYQLRSDPSGVKIVAFEIGGNR